MLLVTISLWDHRRKSDKLIELGDVSKMTVSFQGKTSTLERVGRRWTVKNYNGTPVLDTRANEGMVTHLIDLISALSKYDHSDLDSSEADQYGAKAPELAVTVEWNAPNSPSRSTQETVLFGHRDISDKKVFAYFPARALLVQVAANAVILLENKDPLDIRDRRISTFDPDDVEDLTTLGECGPFTLRRDGDHWIGKQGTGKQGRDLNSGSVDVWLENLLTMHYSGVEEPIGNDRAPTAHLFCTLKLVGRKNRTETIFISRIGQDYWATNSQLPGRYQLSKDAFRLFSIPNLSAKL